MTVHVGILGGGNISETHARAASQTEGVKVVAVAGRNAARVEEMGRRHGAAAYVDIEAFLRHRPLDLVLIGSPSGLHAEQGIAAARHGLHVLVEKPIDVVVRRADELIAECAKAEMKLGVFFQDRFAPDLVRLRDAIAEGVLGRPLLVSARVRWWRPAEYYSQVPWRGQISLAGGGALLNQGIHTIDLLLWLLGDVRRVWARSATLLHEVEVEDTLVAALELESGVLATLETTTAAYPGYPRQIELTGSEGTIVVQQDRIVRADLRTPRPDLVSGEGSTSASASSPVISDLRGHQAVLLDFLRSIREGTEPRCNGPEGRRSLLVVDALYRSARSAEAVSLR